MHKWCTSGQQKQLFVTTTINGLTQRVDKMHLLNSDNN